MPRRAVLLSLLLATPLVAVTRCSPAPPDGGYVDRVAAQKRALAYLEYATEAQVDSPLNAIAHMERDRIDPSYTAPAGQVDVGAWARDFDRIARYQDTRDFGALYMLNAYLGYGPRPGAPDGHPYLTRAQWARIKAALLSFKMWYTDATPPVPDPGDPDCADPPVLDDGVCPDWDNTFYWTENHQILFHVIEYLSGMLFPDECFVQAGFDPTGSCDGVDVNGRRFEYTGSEHMALARPRILRWLDDRWQIGFAEWHSNIYYQKDVTPLLTLVEYGDDPELVQRATIILDQILFDLALHTHDDTLGVTHGRSSMKDKWWGPRNDTWGIVHLLFYQQRALGYFSRGDPGATLLARAKKYRLPQAIERAGRYGGALVDRERHSVFIDETMDAPDAPRPFLGPFFGGPTYMPTVPDANPLHGFDVDILDPGASEGRFSFWWGLGAWTAWQVVPLTLATGDVFNLWKTDLLRDFQALRKLLGPLDTPVPLGRYGIGQSIALGLAPLATVGLLKEANTYTYRTSAYVLSTVQDYRKGRNVGQVHAWNLTLDPGAMVFTQHPMNPVQPPSEWIDRDEGEPGYWSGSASQPRSAQHHGVGIHLYSPVYGDGGVLGFFDYEPFTHAFFPRDRFDEVVQEGPWTFGRKGHVYVALYSWRATRWQAYPPGELGLLGFSQSFDLVADGPPPAEAANPTVAEMGPDNVWIVEVGTPPKFASFEAFRAAIGSASLEVTATPGDIPLGGTAPPEVMIQHFDVVWDSPREGLMRFGWDGDLVVRGEPTPIHDYPRFDNRWIHMERGAPEATIEVPPFRVHHDWPTHTREVSFVP